MLRRLFERLDTTPGQEKVVMAAVDDVQRKGWAARSSMFGARGEVAKAMRSETFDSAAINEILEKQQANLDELKKSVREGLQQIHEAMTPEQRGELADLVEFGPGRGHFGRYHGHRHQGHFDRHQSVNL
jgi:Spy/CpxP family protein refolding chaperone